MDRVGLFCKTLALRQVIKLSFIEHSWWPWRSSSISGRCVLRTQDGWTKRPCIEEQAFICERNINRQPIPLTIRCGSDKSPMTSSTKTTPSTTQRTTIPIMQMENIILTTSEIKSFVEQSSSTVQNKLQQTRMNIIDSSMNLVNSLINNNKIV